VIYPKAITFFMYKILPRYSPILLGVLTENETPDKIALNDRKKLTG
jgi:hypothetical protein